MDDNITEEEKRAYIAGLIDADGCIMLTKRARVHFTPQVTFVNTNEEAVDWVASELGVNSYRMVIYKRREKNKPIYQMVISNRGKVRDVLLKILPYLIIKKRKAELLLEYHTLQNWRQGMREPLLPREREIYLEMKELNRTGRRP